MSDAEIVRANEWRRMWEGDLVLGDGLESRFNDIRMAYFERAGLVEPWEGDKLAKLALAGRILDMVKGHVQAVIEDGAIAATDAAHADKIAALPERKRTWLR
jgi:hypothetical protein